MTTRGLRLLALAGVSALLLFRDGPTSAAAEPSPSTELVLEVGRLQPTSAGPTDVGPSSQYLFSATIKRLDTGEVIGTPLIVTSQGLKASVQFTADSGVQVSLSVLLLADNRLTYELAISGGGLESSHQRATIALPQ